MLTLAQFYGGAFFVSTGGTITPRKGRAQVLGSGSSSSLLVAADSTLAFGGPHVVIFNKSGGTRTLTQGSGALCTLANNASAEIFKSTTGYFALVRTTGAAATSNSGGRSVPIGTATVPSYPAEPTDAPREQCLGSYRQARRCDTGLLVDCWTLDSDIPSLPYFFFLSGLAGGCAYFSELDAPSQIPGSVAPIGSLTSYVSCAACAAANPCAPELMEGCPLIINVVINLPPVALFPLVGGIQKPLQAACAWNGSSWVGDDKEHTIQLTLDCLVHTGTPYWAIHVGWDFSTGGYNPDIVYRVPKVSSCPATGTYPFYLATSDPAGVPYDWTASIGVVG